MIDLRANAPKEFAGKKVLAVRDYKTGTRVSAEGETKLEQPATNALYYELEGDAWICIRPSVTEPKVKLYVNAVTDSAEATVQLLNDLSNAAVDLLNSKI